MAYQTPAGFLDETRTGASSAQQASSIPSSVPSGVAGLVSQLRSISQENTAKSAQQAKELRDWQVQQNRIAMDFSAAQAAKNRDWQKMMSDTAHQREVKDLQAAGLNPILSALGGNGAAVTSGATASGVTSSGAKGDVDTSGSAALASVLGSFLNFQSQMQSMTTSALTNLAVADKYTAVEKYASELNYNQAMYGHDIKLKSAYVGANATLSAANISAAASRYVADQHLTGSLASAAAQRISAAIHADASRYQADQSRIASMYGTDKQTASQQNIAQLNAKVNKELKELGIQAQFDFAEMYPSNEWQADAGQANMRDWIDTGVGAFRDVASGLSSITSALRNSKR